jgi:hypothetical protein
MKRKSPQEKKALSYAKDCRNTYGESDKGARKTIRKNKTIRNQIYRRKVSQILSEIDDTKIETAEIIESKAKSISKGNWKKSPDTPLELFIELQKDMSQRRVGRKMRGTLKESNLSNEVLVKLKKRG